LIIGNFVQLGTGVGNSEIISVSSGAVRVHVVANEVLIGDPEDVGGDEGISFKEGVRDSKIYNDDVHHLVDMGIHIDGGSANWDALITNIAWGNTGRDIRGEDETTIEHNLCRDVDRCEITSGPMFISAPGNFGLSAGSPAIGAASDGGNLGVR
jgi:hypothetical protein